jgi:hypothetical protein
MPKSNAESSKDAMACLGVASPPAMIPLGFVLGRLRTDLHGPYKIGTFTMKSTKTLMIAAAAALLIGAGAAMAQSQVPSSREGTYYSQPPTVTNSQDQAGSSDVQTGYQVAWDYSTLANPG